VRGLFLFLPLCGPVRRLFVGLGAWPMSADFVIEEFDHSRLADLARKVLTERQFAIWTRTHRDGWTAARLASELGVCRATVENDLRAARKRLNEALEQAGNESSPFHVIVRREGTAASVVDRTPSEAAWRIEREEKRQGRIRTK